MRKFLLVLSFWVSFFTLNAQTVLFEDNFDSHNPFIITGIGGWTTNDVDGSITYGIFTGTTEHTFPNTGTPYAFMVFNPLSTTPPFTAETATAHSGSQYLMSMASQTPPNNDWIISPSITLGESGNKVKFWAKSYSDQYGLERFKVAVSTTGTNPADFTVISTGAYIQAPITWTEYTFDLDAYAGQNVYIAINSVSNDAWMFFVDDFSVVTGDDGGGPTDYCNVTIPADRVEPITRVVFAGIDNSSSPVIDGSDPHEFFLDIEGNVEAGQTYPIALEGNTDGTFRNTFTVFIDWNQDGDFADAGEMFEAGSIYNSNGTDGQQATADITVPADALAGATRMRIIKDFTTNANPVWPSDPCGTYDYGQAEDYTLNVGGGPGPEGCFVTGTFDQWPSNTVTPACLGVVEAITTAGWAGEFSKVQVSAGVEYIFSSSVATDFITIADEDEEIAFVTGTGSVTWTSPIDQVIRFYTHLDENCTIEEVSRTRSVQCGEVPPPPSDCEDFVVLSNNLENGLFFGGSTSQHLATDIPVADTGFTLYGMEPTVIGTATSFEFIIYSDASGLPGTQLDTRTGIIVDEVVTGNNFGYDFIKYTVGFDSPINLDANTIYWIEIISDAAGWETTSAAGSAIGYGDVFYNTNVGQGVWTSTGGDEMVFNLICSELGVSEISSFDFTYHPNPVKDVLNISAKKNVENVSVFNLASQKVLNNAKVSNGQINVSALTPGTYVFHVTLEGGQVETFKIIKK